jgi:hypothetical protein
LGTNSEFDLGLRERNNFERADPQHDIRTPEKFSVAFLGPRMNGVFVHKFDAQLPQVPEKGRNLWKSMEGGMTDLTFLGGGEGQLKMV